MKVLECEMTVPRESRAVSSRAASPYCTLVEKDPSRPLLGGGACMGIHTYVTLVGVVEVGISKFLTITRF